MEMKETRITNKLAIYACDNEAISPRYEHSSAAPLKNKRAHTHTQREKERGGGATSAMGSRRWLADKSYGSKTNLTQLYFA